MKPSDKIACLPVPCTSCPYRRDVPSGVWDQKEYAKLPAYDLPTWQQPTALFMCHHNTQGLCTGWLQSHAAREHTHDLLASRFPGRIDVPAVSAVALSKPKVALFRTGAQAARHGMKDIRRPGRKANQAIARLAQQRQARAEKRLLRD